MQSQQDAHDPQCVINEENKKNINVIMCVHGRTKIHLIAKIKSGYAS